MFAVRHVFVTLKIFDRDQ